MQVRTVTHVTLTDIEAKEILITYLARQYGCKPEEIELWVVAAEQEKTEALHQYKY